MGGVTPGTSGQQYNVHPVNVVSPDESSVHCSKLNISSQTGEEFSEEFLREGLTPRRPPVVNENFQQHYNKKVTNVCQSRPLVYEDLTGLLGIQRRDSASGTEVSDFSIGKGYILEVGSQQQAKNILDRSNSGRAASRHASDSPNSYQPYNRGLGFRDGSSSSSSSSSSSAKMKFLCSFGGRILPRPNDGKLRYVGGETRIMSIRKNLAYSDLVRKTTSICNQSHTIKYQLPGEELDALISVSCDEDLHHMIEEYLDLERRSQRLRIFLVSSNDPDTPCSLEARNLPQADANYQYFVAVNGMLDPSHRRSSSRESLGSQKGSAMDGSPTIRESPSSFHPSDKMNHPSPKTQVFNAPSQHPSKAYYSPTFPVPIQLKEPKDSRTKFNEDITHEFNCPNAVEQVYDNSYYMDATSLYYNQLPDTLRVNNYYQPVSPHIESNQTVEPHSHILSSAKSFAVFPSYANVEVEARRHIFNEMTTLSGNVPLAQDTVVQFPTSSALVDPPNRLVHALSQPQLLINEKSGVTFEEWDPFLPSLLLEKSPSFCGSSQQSLIQQVEKSEEKNQGARNDHIPTADWNEEFIEWHKDTSNWTQNKGTSLEDGSTSTKIVNRASEIHIDPSLPKQPEAQRTKNFISPSSSVEKSGHILGGRKGENQSSLDDSEFFIKCQKANEDQQQASYMPFDLNCPPINDVSFANPANTTKSVTVDPTHQQTVHDARWTVENGSQISVKKGSLRRDSPEKPSFQDRMLLSYPSTKQQDGILPELTVIVEDVTNIIVSDVPSSPAIIPLVQDVPSDGMLSPGGETETESIVLESEQEEGNIDDDNDKNASLSDSVTIEMEAGIYGLQIIKYGDLEELQELGSGTFGTVYHGKWRGTDVAIKRIKKSCFAGRLSEQDRLTKEFWREAQILSKLHHPNVVAFYGVVPDGPGGTLATVTEFMIDGSLRHVLLRKGTLDRRKKLMIALDAAFGMEYLHLKNIVHFDLKCDNLLVNLGDPHRPVCKVGDFGLSRIKRNTLVSGGVRGTLPWMAPELLHGINNRVSEKVDVFSFGITMWEMLTGEEPYANLHCGAIIGGIVNNTLRPRIPERCDPEWRKLMEECWSPDPSARPSFTEITNRLRVMSMALQPKRPNRIRR